MPPPDEPGDELVRSESTDGDELLEPESTEEGSARPAQSGFSKSDWFGLCVALILTAGGLLSVATAAGWNLMAWRAHRVFDSSDEARRAALIATAPTSVWTGPDPTATASADTTADQPPAVSSATNDAIDLVDASFVFLDPPQPGARARLSINLFVHRTDPSPSVSVSIPTDWFDGYRLATTAPPSIVDADADPAIRRLVFNALPPGTLNITIDVVATGERVDPPVAHLELTETNEAIGDAHPRTVAPRPRPGPVSALRIPRLGLNVAVVPTTWEPPAFLVGQLRTSADVTLGNTVLVGHLGGAAGDVFKNLNQLQPGDAIGAVSRGLEYSFVVSVKQVRPASESQPTLPTASPRLTLMTCTGTWDPVAHNYSDRLWITAEPPALAAASIAASASRPPLPQPTPSAPLPLPTATPESQPERALATGLGAERATLDATLGPPLGETAGKLVVYRKGASEYHVAYTPDPPRAQLLTLQPIGSAASLSIPTAVQTARAGFPSDAEPRVQAPEGSATLVVERFASPALASILGDSPRGGQPGDFVAAYARDPSGSVTRVVVAAGDDVDAAIRDAAQ